MAGKIQVQYDVAGLNLYAQIRNYIGQIWDGDSFETYVTANIGDYDIALAEQGTASRYYAVDFPTAILAGLYFIVILQRVGSSPAETDPPISGGSINWDGTDIIGLAGNAAADRHRLAAKQIIPGTVDTAGLTPTTTQFEADDITEATANHFAQTDNARSVIFTSGALLGQAASITAYSLVSGRGRFTVAAMTEAPANNDTFIII